MAKPPEKTAPSAQSQPLEGGGLVDDVDQHPNAHRQRALVEVERRLMQVELLAAARPHAQPCHRAGNLLEIPREVLAAAGLAGGAEDIGAHPPPRLGGKA